MATVLFRQKGTQFFNANIATPTPLAGGLLNYYQAGTTLPQDTYSEQTGTTKNANPVQLDPSGRLLTPIYLGSNNDYKEVLTDALGVTQAPWPFDGIPRAQAATNPITGFERLYLPWSTLTAASSPVTLLNANAGAAYEIDCSGGNVVVNLPSVVSIQSGTGYTFKRIDAVSANTATIVPNGADQIDSVNAAIGVFPGGNAVSVNSDGAAWQIDRFHSPQGRFVGGRQSVTASAAALSINMNLGWNVQLSLAASVTSVAVTNWPPSGSLGKLFLEISSTGAFTMAGWPGTTIWSGGTAPTITSGNGKRDSLLLTSFDGGTTFRGYVVGQNMS